MIVMIICHFDDTNLQGGLEQQARRLGLELRAGGADVVVLSSTRDRSRARWIDEDGLPVRFFWTYNSPQISGRYLPAALIWAAQVLLWVIKHRKRVQLIHVHQLRIHAFVAAFVHRFFGIPCVLKSATGGGKSADIQTIATRKYFGRAGQRFVIAQGTRFVATTKAIEDDLLAAGVPAHKIVAIPNGVRLSAATVLPPPPEIRRRKLLFLGRLSGDKNVLPLARAMIEGPEDMAITFLGHGSEQGALTELAQHDPQKRISVQGWVDDPGPALSQHGFLLLPSSGEGLSNAMIEAMAFGVVPVSTRVSGSEHIVAGENGFFFDGLDGASLRARLAALAQITVVEWERLSAAAQRHARAHFDFAQVRAKYEALYAELTSKRLCAS